MNIVSQTAIAVQQKGDTLVVDSRLIAIDLGIEHASLLKTIKKYLDRLERKEPVGFEIAVVKRPQGGTYEETYCYLNEWQANLLMTFSRNTEQVLDCKERLVEAFSKAKETIQTVIPAQADRIRILEMELELSRNQRYLLDKSEAIAQLHGPAMLALIQNRPDAVVEKIEKVTETIVVENGRTVTFEGKSLAELGKELGFKTGTQFENWLRKHKSDHLICEGFRKVGASYIPTENLKEVKRLWTEYKDRQLLIGE